MSGPGAAASPAAAQLERRLGEAQRSQRLPAVSAEVRRGASTLWSGAVHASADHAFRIGSITKTFTAVLVLQCRDGGLLELDDPVSAHLPVALPAGVTIRRLLSHLSGVQREPAGDLWAGGPVPDDAGLLAALGEQVLPPARRFHYSNLGYALLGRIVAERRGQPWYEALRTQLLDPLGLSRTTLEPVEPVATGGFTQPWSDEVVAEPRMPTGAAAPAMQLWSTAGDLAAFGVFLAAPDPALLAPGTVREMAEVAVMADRVRWGLAYGLGLMLVRRGDRVLVGHAGAMPGFLAGLSVDPDSGTVAAVLTAAGRAADADGLAASLVEDALEHDPPVAQPWTPGAAPPPEVADLLGHWWTEGSELTLSWHGRLEAVMSGAPDWTPPAVFEPEGPHFRTVAGRECGELLRVGRDGAGRVASLHWATYALTRAPTPFAALLAPPVD